MTRLFWQDPYIKEFDAVVLDIIGNKIVLDQTAFYAESGGQISDSGTLNTFNLTDVQYSGSGKTIYHFVDATALKSIKKKAPVNGIIDWDRRHQIMRHHSALHIVYLVFEQVHGTHKIIGSQVRFEKARVDFAFFENADLDKMQSLIDSIILSDRAISMYPSEKDPDYRYWEIADYPPIPCGGTHVRSTGEIGKILLKRKSLGSQGVRFYCSTGDIQDLD